jgi:hypothetical protein
LKTISASCFGRKYFLCSPPLSELQYSYWSFRCHSTLPITPKFVTHTHTHTHYRDVDLVAATGEALPPCNQIDTPTQVLVALNDRWLHYGTLLGGGFCCIKRNILRSCTADPCFDAFLTLTCSFLDVVYLHISH